jgi:hypothetical protein
MHLPLNATADAFAPHWSAEELAAAVPQALPPLHRFEFRLPANAAALHRPRRSEAGYAAQRALRPFRIGG